MGARIRNVSGGSIKFRRKLNIKWELEEITSESSVIGDDGTVEKAIAFGDPLTLTKDPLILNDTEFFYFRREGSTSISSSTGRLHKVVDGPFFKSFNQSDISERSKILTSLGAWIPNLPNEEELIVKVDDIAADGVYEIRCIFSDGKSVGSKDISINSGERLVLPFDGGTVLKGQFISPESSLKLAIKSNDQLPPFINAIVMKRLGHTPRTTARFTG